MTSTITVSTLNIFDLSEIISDIKESITESVDVNPVINPAYYSVANLPDEVKAVIIQKLQSSPHADLLQGIIQYMLENK